MVKKVNYRLLRDLLLIPLSILFTVLVVEGLFYAIYEFGKYNKFPSDIVIMQGQFPASFHLSDQDISVLRNPTSSVGATLFNVLMDRNAAGSGQLASMQFYSGELIYKVRTDASENDYLKRKLKGKPVTSFSKPNEMFKDLQNKVENGAKLIITLGGSTTAWSINWPYNF